MLEEIEEEILLQRFKEYKILKPNELINSHLIGSPANSIKLLDRLWYQMNLALKNGKEFDINKKYAINYSLQDLKDFINIPNSVNSYREIIEDALKGLCKYIKIKNYIDIEGNVVESLNEPLLSYKKYKNKDTDNEKEKSFTITLSSELFALMINKKKGTFTNLYSRHQQKLRTGNHIILYQRLKSLQFLKYKKEISLNEFQSFLSINKKSKRKLKYISEAEKIVERALKPINDTTDIIFSYTVDKKNKSIIFKIGINKDNMTIEEIETAIKLSKHKKKTKQEIEEEEKENIINNLMGEE